MRLARAKTNLFLEVPARRPDGFHELDTVFVELDLADTVRVEAAESIALEVVGDDSIPTGEQNLVWQVVEQLRTALGQPELGARITIEKRLPAGGGLGGGSSDAAATLLACCEAWQAEVDPRLLHQVAASLGSDVAFFIDGGLQRGRGRGELLFPLAPLATPLDLVLVFPPFPCPTPEVYKALAPFLPEAPRSADDLLQVLHGGDVRAIGERLFNRLEEPACAFAPALAELKADLLARDGVVAGLLSGSGSTYVCLLEDAAAAERLQSDLEAAGQRAVATKTASAR